MPPSHKTPASLPILVPRALLLLFLMSVLVACARTPRNDMPSPYLVEMLPPDAGATSLSVRITDGSGEIFTDALVSLEGNMNHAGMVPVLAGPVADADDGTTDGVYTVPFEFTMLGDWIVTVEAVVDPDSGDTVLADFELSVSPEDVELSIP
jgi:hypothetical protein